MSNLKNNPSEFEPNKQKSRARSADAAARTSKSIAPAADLKALTKTRQPRPWLVAAWPGMGHVGVIAAGTLVNQLRMKAIGEFSGEGFFDHQHVIVKDGVIQKPQMPRTMLYSTPSGSRNPLLVLLSESQPTSNSFAFAHKILEKAVELGVERVVTFASLASRTHPSDAARVNGAATDNIAGGDLKRLDIQPLTDGAVSGMSGVLLGAAAERGLSGLCLLGEIPAFAAAMPNPKAAEAIVATFGVMRNVSVDTRELAEHGKTVESVLLDLMRRAEAGELEAGDEAESGFGSRDGSTPEDSIFADTEPPSSGPAPHQVDDFDRPMRPQPVRPARPNAEVLADLESLFAKVQRDRSSATELKSYLDSHGLFAQYENRFLDLFKHAA